MSNGSLERGRRGGAGVVHERPFGNEWRFARVGGVGSSADGPQLSVPTSVADKLLALRLLLATRGGDVRICSQTWYRRGVDTLRSGLTCCLDAAQLRDLQRIVFALFDWDPRQFNDEAVAVLSWCDDHLPPPPQLPLLLLRLKHQYDQLCDLKSLEWADLITRLSPDLPEVVARDWLGLVALEAADDALSPDEWYDFLVAGRAIEPVAFAIAVGDVEFLEAISHCLLYCPRPPVDQPEAVPPPEADKEIPDGLPVEREPVHDDHAGEAGGSADSTGEPAGMRSRIDEESAKFEKEKELFELDWEELDSDAVSAKAPASRFPESLAEELRQAAQVPVVHDSVPAVPVLLETDAETPSKEGDLEQKLDVLLSEAQREAGLSADRPADGQATSLGELAERAFRARQRRMASSGDKTAPIIFAEHSASPQPAVGSEGRSAAIVWAGTLALALAGTGFWWLLAGAPDRAGTDEARPAFRNDTEARPEPAPVPADASPAETGSQDAGSDRQLPEPEIDDAAPADSSPDRSGRWSILLSYPGKGSAIAEQHRLARTGVGGVVIREVERNGETWYQLEIMSAGEDAGDD